MRLEHSGSQVLEHLVNVSKDVQIKDAGIKEIKTVECDACEISKAKHRIQQESREIKQKPGIQLVLDFYDHEERGLQQIQMSTADNRLLIWSHVGLLSH